MPPETVLASGPPDSIEATDYRVHFFWSGRDSDGTIDHYDLILVDHPAAHRSIAGDDSASTVMIRVPSVDDPRWTHTDANDSLFVTRADTLRRDPQPGEGETGGDVLETPFERWHTLFVRAVDNEGTPDPTPEYRSFNAVNFAPTVALRKPVRPGQTFTGPPVVVFNWDGADPLGDGTVLEPVAARWVLIPSDIEGLSVYTSWPDSLYRLPARYAWSPWRPWGASDSSGVRAVVRGLQRVGQVLDPPSGFYIFAVQALDEAGAVTPVFDTQTHGRNNAVLVRVSGSVGPTLIVSERFMGTRRFVGATRPVNLDVATGQPVNFHWTADASAYGGSIEGYRFAWNLRDPTDPSQWSSWSATALEAPTRTFTSGNQRFFLQVRDNAESITSIEFELSVHRVTASRDVLWIDDGAEIIRGSGIEVRQDQRWTGVLRELAVEHAFSFEPGADVYDVSESRFLPPPIDLVFQYKNLVWNVVPGTMATGLEETALFRDPFAPRHLTAVARFNYLDVYIENGGNLWISGFKPAYDMWPDEERPFRELADPVNVTNWNDPLEPHPFQDSAGVVSLAYKMGIEMFEIGAGLGTKRPQLEHYCQGLRRVGGVDPQLFETDEILDHTHTLAVPRADIESSTLDGVTYELTSGDVPQGETWVPHRHAVTLNREQLRALVRGEELHLQTSAWDGGAATHMHDVQLRDQFGVWGAPLLQISAAWPQPEIQPRNLTGRPNVEIYNMPIGMSQALPPLVPRLERTVPVYEYVSGVRADPASGVVYPLTADGQPVFLLTRRHAADKRFARAICGFDPYDLTADSHLRLAHFVLVRHFGLGTLVP